MFFIGPKSLKTLVKMCAYRHLYIDSILVMFFIVFLWFVSGAVRRNPTMADTNDSDIQKEIVQYLHGAPDRNNGSQKRRTKSQKHLPRAMSPNDTSLQRSQQESSQESSPASSQESSYEAEH